MLDKNVTENNETTTPTTNNARNACTGITEPDRSPSNVTGTQLGRILHQINGNGASGDAAQTAEMP